MFNLKISKFIIAVFLTLFGIVVFAVFTSYSSLGIALLPVEPTEAIPQKSTVNLTINKSSFLVGGSWTLNVTTNPLILNMAVTICSKAPSPSGDSCTPAANLGHAATTDASGKWTASGMMRAGDVGTWDEYVVVDMVRSNHIYFTVTEPSLTCQLAVSKTDICVGDTATWNINSDPTGLFASWFGTKDGVTDATDVPAGISGNPETYGPYNCSTLGTYTRYAQVKSSTGQTCTTNTVNVTVRDCTGVCSNGSGQDIPPLSPPACSDHSSFASPCQTGTTTVLTSTPQVDAGKQTHLTVYIKPPSDTGDNIIWSSAYLWREDRGNWQQFTLNGPAHLGSDCSDPAACWLTGSGWAELDIPASAARGNAFYIAAWYYVKTGGDWEAATCSAGSCWTLTSALDWPAISEQIRQATTIDEALAIARAAGLTVNEYFSADNARAAEIKHPLTGEMLAVLTQQKVVKFEGNTPGTMSACSTPKDGDKPRTRFGIMSDGQIYGVQGDYQMFFNASTLPTSQENQQKINANISAAVAFYDSIPDGPHTSSTARDSIEISWTPGGEKANALTVSIRQPDGTFANKCKIHVDSKDSDFGLDKNDISDSLAFVIQHEIGHCFGFSHSEGIMDPYSNSKSRLIPKSDIMNYWLPILRKSKVTTIKVTNCLTMCPIGFYNDLLNNKCVASTSGGGAEPGVTPEWNPADGYITPPAPSSYVDWYYNGGYYRIELPGGMICDCFQNSSPQCYYWGVIWDVYPTTGNVCTGTDVTSWINWNFETP